MWLLNTLKGGARHQFIKVCTARYAFTSFVLAHYACSTSPKHGSALNTHSNDFICSYIEHVTSHTRKIASEVTVRGDGGVAREGRVAGVPKFHSWGYCTMPLTNINSDWMSNASSGLRIILYYAGSLSCFLGIMFVCTVD